MTVVPGKIYLLDRPRLRASTYARPCLVLEVNPERITIAYFSTKVELASPRDLSIDERDDGFKRTGLTQTSILLGDHIARVPPSDFHVIRELGEIDGWVKKLIEDWYGAPIR